jgi:hypothetical protein
VTDVMCGPLGEVTPPKKDLAAKHGGPSQTMESKRLVGTHQWRGLDSKEGWPHKAGTPRTFLNIIHLSAKNTLEQTR